MSQFYGEKFLRQHPMRCIHDDKEHFFVPDFYCAKHKLDLEFDGEMNFPAASGGEFNQE
ncbi:MAG: endonuclease domain-containing protein [Bacteroidetes bacterium]|nr:endonuclease domain-containing protein [Bacteroidota bacterium]